MSFQAFHSELLQCLNKCVPFCLKSAKDLAKAAKHALDSPVAEKQKKIERILGMWLCNIGQPSWTICKNPFVGCKLQLRPMQSKVRAWMTHMNT